VRALRSNLKSIALNSGEETLKDNPVQSRHGAPVSRRV
jgi:hypothetical protein